MKTYQIINQTDTDHNFDITKNHLPMLTIDYVPNYYYLGTYLKEFSNHDDSPKNQKIYSLFDDQTYQKLGLNMEYNIFLVNNASAHGNLNFLNKWEKSRWKLKYSTDTMDLASQNGHLNILKWWKQSGYKLKYTSYAIDWACEYGQLDVLVWWFQSGLEIRCTQNAIKLAFLNRHHHIISWWQEYQTLCCSPRRMIDCKQMVISSTKYIWDSIVNLPVKQLMIYVLFIVLILCVIF